MTRRWFVGLLGLGGPAILTLSKEALAAPAGGPTNAVEKHQMIMSGSRIPAVPTHEMVSAIERAERDHRRKGCRVRRLELEEFWTPNQEANERWLEVGCKKCHYNLAFSLRYEGRVHTFKA